MIVFIDVFLLVLLMFEDQRSTLNAQHPTLNSAAASSTMTARETRRAAAWLQVLSSCFESLAVGLHPLQPDSFILGSAGRGQRPAATVSRSFVSIRG